MKSLSILMALLVSGALSAQSHINEANARVVLFGEGIQTSGILLGQGIKDQANYQTGVGLRIMGQVSLDSPWYFELSGRFPSSANMVTNRDISSTPPPNVLDATKIKIFYSYLSLGAGYLIPLGNAADFGIHLEGRSETINPKGTYSTTNGGTGYTNSRVAYLRPWVRLSMDLKMKTESFTTIFGGEVGVAAIKANQRTIMPMSQLDDQTMRALAPTWSGAVYVGVQF